MREKVIGLKELRQNMDKYAAQVQMGRPITVFKRSKPLFKLIPVDDDDDANWETLIDFRKFPGYENGIDAEELLMRLRKLDGQSRQGPKKTNQG
ncbi:MAG: type II toxin-antitoxin system prevent-host-death family antitoxin [Patescibacteria group bacterium]